MHSSNCWMFTCGRVTICQFGEDSAPQPVYMNDFWNLCLNIHCAPLQWAAERDARQWAWPVWSLPSLKPAKDQNEKGAGNMCMKEVWSLCIALPSFLDVNMACFVLCPFAGHADIKWPNRDRNYPLWQPSIFWLEIKKKISWKQCWRFGSLFSVFLVSSNIEPLIFHKTNMEHMFYVVVVKSESNNVWCK